MCLAVPGRVVGVAPEDGVLFGTVDFGGVVKRVCFEHTSDAQPGDYVLVHVGFAMARLDGAEAFRLLQFLESMGEADEAPEGAE
jgi:hydrogenase expression/formation protein HypC